MGERAAARKLLRARGVRRREELRVVAGPRDGHRLRGLDGEHAFREMLAEREREIVEFRHDLLGLVERGLVVGLHFAIEHLMARLRPHSERNLARECLESLEVHLDLVDQAELLVMFFERIVAQLLPRLFLEVRFESERFLPFKFGSNRRRNSNHRLPPLIALMDSNSRGCYTTLPKTCRCPLSARFLYPILIVRNFSALPWTNVSRKIFLGKIFFTLSAHSISTTLRGFSKISLKPSFKSSCGFLRRQTSMW